MTWKDFAEELVGTSKDAVKKAAEYAEDYRIYPRSITKEKSSFYFLAKVDKKKKLIILNESREFDKFQGKTEELAGFKAKIAPLSSYNAELIREIFPYTAPKSMGRKVSSIGLGDRLGIATPGHIDAVRDRDVMPVFAQQSVRELNFTGRSFKDVLDDVTWAVFQEDYKKGFGADADHLKEKSQISEVLELGYTMITLDCTEYIDDSILEMDEEELIYEYSEVPEYLREGLENHYLDKTFVLNSGYELEYNEDNFARIVLTYYKMLDFAREVNHLLKMEDRDIDFEISIDETSTPTTPEAHFFVANELKRNGIFVNSLAPRFIGDFQKGIDYVGKLSKFDEEFKVHAEIAERFGYRLSIHSGSDKFSVFPIIGEYTKGRVHVKTAGTNWLEAVRIIAENDSSLYRDIHQHALKRFEDASEYYHVNTDLSKVPDLARVSDQELPELLEINEVRQLLHITYGYILQDKAGEEYLFRNRLYDFWESHEKEYRAALKTHIGRHLDKLSF